MKEAAGYKILIIGTGGHAKEVCDVAVAAGFTVAGFFSEPHCGDNIFRGCPVVESLEEVEWDGAVIAIGDNRVREAYAERLDGRLAPALIHPTVVLGSGATVGAGTVVMAGAVISSDTHIGENCILNPQSYIAHDCLIGSNTHVAAGSMINGGCSIGERTLIGSGTVVLPQISIGSDCTTGAGSTVVKPVKSETTVVGCPAREIL